jgi:DNA-directed RNA polymerase specialized sigma24 family protein
VDEETKESAIDRAEAEAFAKAEAALEQACLPPWEGPGLPPELAAVPRAELIAARRVVFGWAIKESKSKALAEELVPIVYLKMASTRRWNSAKGPFGRHFMLCMKSELSHHFKSKAPEKEAAAREGYAREELPTTAASAEDHIIRAETETEDTAAREAKATREVALLRERIASHDLMPKVIACLERGAEGPRVIADELGVPVVKVYRALDLMRHHLKKIRETEGEEKK